MKEFIAEYKSKVAMTFAMLITGTIATCSWKPIKHAAVKHFTVYDTIEVIQQDVNVLEENAKVQRSTHDLIEVFLKKYERQRLIDSMNDESVKRDLRWIKSKWR